MNKENNPELADKLRALAIRHFSQISDMVDKAYLTAWFRAFMKSPEFERLPAEMKVIEFDSYCSINKYLNEVFEIIDAEPG